MRKTTFIACLVTCVVVCGEANAQPPIPPGGSCVVTVTDVTRVQFTQTIRSEQVSGAYNVAAGWSLGSVLVKAIYLDGEGNPTGYFITQGTTAANGTYSGTFMNMPQTTEQFWIQAKITVTRVVNGVTQSDVYERFAGGENPTVYSLYP